MCIDHKQSFTRSSTSVTPCPRRPRPLPFQPQQYLLKPPQIRRPGSGPRNSLALAVLQLHERAYPLPRGSLREAPAELLEVRRLRVLVRGDSAGLTEGVVFVEVVDGGVGGGDCRAAFLGGAGVEGGEESRLVVSPVSVEGAEGEGLVVVVVGSREIGLT